jgi:hypothetical protein
MFGVLIYKIIQVHRTPVCSCQVGQDCNETVPTVSSISQKKADRKVARQVAAPTFLRLFHPYHPRSECRGRRRECHARPSLAHAANWRHLPKNGERVPNHWFPSLEMVRKGGLRSFPQQLFYIAALGAPTLRRA